MTYTYIIANLVGIKDTNIELNEEMQIIKGGDGHTTRVLSGTLSYQFEACPKCGVRNQSNQDMIKHDSVMSTFKLPNMTFGEFVLKLKKQRYLCKHCGKTTAVPTTLDDHGYCISNIIKQVIAIELVEVQSMTLIEPRYSVSDYTVAKELKKAGKALGSSYCILPEHIGFDEFKSVKSVQESMSRILMDAHGKKLFDILLDRKQNTIPDYFIRYSYESHQALKTITMDMYSPYYDFLQRIFPNAKIIIDRVHLVQLLNRSLNQERIRIMKLIKTNRPRDCRKLKQLWKLILKNREELDFKYYRSHRLFDGLVTQKMMVNYMVSLEDRFERAYRMINDLKAILPYMIMRGLKRISMKHGNM